MTIDAVLLGIVITLIMSILGGGVWLGRMSEKVRGNRYDINAHKEDLKEDRKQNREEHLAMIKKLDTIIHNGYGRKQQ